MCENKNENTYPKGSINNPYTEKEFDKMCDDGTWTGGFVEGYPNYLGPQAIITPSSEDEDWYSSEDPFGSWSDPWTDTSYPEFEPINENNNHGDGSRTDTNVNQNGTNTTGSYLYTGSTASSSATDIISVTSFKGYKQSDPQGCFRRCKEMLAEAQCQVSGQEIAMTHYDENGRATTATSDFKSRIQYINSQINLGHPVIVSVDYKDGTSMGGNRKDKAGDHFVIIVGGSNSSGYHYFDPATAYQSRGTSKSNLFTEQNGILRSTNTCTGSTRHYTLTGIRKNK